ncbi:ABC transporter related protein [Oceanithermus profundus DSM 14977]|uniref:ABC transporter related protein n=2 Tax=Oceanithermus profundus TaxID=187137 RepID=E4U6W0_OCEP5|nr:ABC transporter related protein [Oceanithermus profundus DSM 14977]
MLSRFQSMAFALGFVLRAAPTLALGFWGLLVLRALVPAAVVLAVGRLAAAAATGDGAALARWGGVWLGALLAEWLLGPLAGMVEGNLNERLTARVNRALMEKMNAFEGLEPFENAEFYERVERLRREASYAPMNLSIFLGQVLLAGLTALPLLALVARWGWVYPPALLLSTLPYALAGVRLQRLVWETVVGTSPEARRMDYATGVALSPELAAETRLFASGGFWTRFYERNFRVLHARGRAVRRREVAVSGVYFLPSALGLGWTFWSVLKGGVGVGGVVEVTAALQRLQAELVLLVDALGMLERSLYYMDELRAFLETKPRIAGGRLRLEPGPPEVVFEDVSFSYPDGRAALEQVSLRLEPGVLSALVGENGAGKTTLVKLLLRYYDPSEGRILVDGVDLRELDLAAWRRRVSAVFQSFGRYALSLAENVRIADLDSQAPIEPALAQAGAAALARRLPAGPATPLGKAFGGTELSGGEWQKVALARAFFRKADLLIFDEPTAALDPRSEAALFSRFAELARGRTALLVSHRLASVRSAGRIFVFKTGRLVESGGHDELLAGGGEYAELWRLQSARYA